MINRIYPLLLSVCASAPLMANVTLLSESFDGSGSDPLNGQTATTYSSQLTAAGGSSTWIADESGSVVEFRADGAIIDSADDSAAYLSVGSYINDAKGTSAGVFIIEATYMVAVPGSSPASGDFVSVGFLSSSATTSTPFFTDSVGIGTAIIRESNGTGTYNYFPGPGTAGGGGDKVSTGVAHTFTIVLDLSSYDGLSDFGTASYYLDGSDTIAYSSAITSAVDYAYVGFTENNVVGGTISSFSLSQVPEPSTYACFAGVAVLFIGLLLRRRG